MFKSKKDREKSVEKDPNILKGVSEIIEEGVHSNMNEHKPTLDRQEPILDLSDLNFEEDPRSRTNSIHETGPEHYVSKRNKQKQKSRQKSRESSRDRQSSTYELNIMENDIRELGEDPNFKKTIFDGLGRMLLEFSAQIKEVSKKTNVPYTKDTDEICEEYTGYLDGLNRIIESRIENEVQEKMGTEIKKFKTERLGRSYMNQTETIFPPQTFNENTFGRHSDQRINSINSAFPIRTKFDGSKRPGIVEFLRNINFAQSEVNCTRKDFLNNMLRCTTGTVYEELASMIDGNISLEEIYNNLLTKYDTRKKPEVAKQELDNYMPPSDATLATVQSKIMSLGQRACLLYANEARTMAYNFDCVKALIKALPKASHNDGLKLLQDLNHEYERAPTFSEYSSAISRYSPNIDYNYKEERGSRISRNMNDDKKGSFFNQPFRRTEASRRHATVKQIDRRASPVAPERKYDNNYRNNSQPRYNSFNNNRYNNRKIQPNNRFNPNQNGYQGNNLSNSNKEPLGIKGRHHCSLCGSSSHSASSGCYKMRNDFGRLVFCAPSSGSCERCEKEEGKILYHPSNLCFNRDIMKEFYKEGKYKFPTYQERKEMAELISRGNKQNL